MERSWPLSKAKSPPAKAQHHRIVDAGRPDDRAVQDLVEVVEQQVPTVLRRLDDAGVPGRADGKPEGTADAGRPERVDGHGHRRRVALEVPDRDGAV
jgi:hypothetical protein